MGSNTKRRTTMAKLNREQRQREKRMEKEMRKNDRKAGEGEEAVEEVAFDESSLDRPVPELELERSLRHLG